jgi:YHS domain-containing protein
MMPSVKYMHVQRRLPLVKAKCKRCKESFVYYRRGRHRYFCGETCREKERKDANDFYNARASEERLAARQNAVQAHLARGFLHRTKSVTPEQTK